MTDTNSSAPTARVLPRWAIVLSAIVVVVLILALAAPYFLNVDHYRDDIANALKQQTGRQVTLGKIQARIIPEIGVVIDDFQLGNPKDFPSGDLISSDQIMANLAFWPLLRGVIHLKSFELVHPRLTILTDEQGHNNYTFESTSASAPIVKAASASSSSSSSMPLDQIDSIVLSNIEVALGNVSHGAITPSATAKGISVTLHNFVVSPFTVHAWNADSNLAGVTLAFAGWSAPITFNTGKLTLSGGKVDAQFVADLAKASEVRGTLNVPDIEKPQVNFEISSPKMDIDALIAAVGGSSTSTASQPTPEPAPAQTVFVKNPAPPASTAAPSAPAGTGELVARGHINIESISSKPYVVGPANAEIRVYTDRAELWPITVGMYGGTLQVSSRVDRSTNPPRFTANVQMRGLDVAKVLEADPSAAGKMSGTGELDLQILGELTDDWRKTVSGTGKFAVRNGTLPGVNLAGAAGSIAKLTGVSGSTPFTILQGDVSIADQRVASKQIHLESGLGTVDLKGSVGMDETLDYEGVIALTPGGSGTAGNVLGLVGGLLGSKGGKISVPFALAGTIESPKFKPGNGTPSFSRPGSTSASTQAGQGTTPANTVDTLKSLFKKH